MRLLSMLQHAAYHKYPPFIDHRELGWEVVKWMHVAGDRDKLRTLVKTVIKLQIP
jgi:hypothetical protein